MKWITLFADVKYLNQRARESSFPGNQVPALKLLEPTNILLVTDLPEQANEFVLKLLFQSFGSVQEVSLRAPGCAVVTFNDAQSKW